MRAIVFTEPGPSSVLQVVEREVPTPGAGEIRVKIAVSGVNPTDWKARVSGSSQASPEYVPNQDGSGTIDAVGEGVTGFAVGDRVWLAVSAWQRPTSGTAQEFTLARADRAFRLPDEASFDEGANLGVPAITAHRALTVGEDTPNRLQPGAFEGATVLVAGGAGAVGHAAIQLARWAGATVITTVSNDEKAALARAAGAHHVLNYRDADIVEQIRAIAPNGVNHIVEVAVSANNALNTAVAATRATIAIYANDRGEALTIEPYPAMVLNLRYQFVLVYHMGDDAFVAAGEDINAALRAGVLPLGEDAGLPVQRFPLEQTAAAHDAVQNDFVGKVLIDVQ